MATGNYIIKIHAAVRHGKCAMAMGDSQTFGEPQSCTVTLLHGGQGGAAHANKASTVLDSNALLIWGRHFHTVSGTAGAAATSRKSRTDISTVWALHRQLAA